MSASGVAPLAVTVGLGLATVLLVGVGERFRVPYPVLVLLLGGALAIVPGIPTPQINADLILPVFLPPLVFAAVRRTSWPMVRARRRTILSLAVLLVVLTVLGVAGVVTALLPAVSLAAAVAFGALVSPPDPVAAAAVAARINLPRRLESILEVEGLCNDATALVVYTVAAAAIGDGALSVPWVLLSFVYGLVAAVAVGFAIARIALWVLSRLTDTNARSGFTLIVPFATYLAADEVHASGVLAVLTVGLMLGSAEAEETGVADRLIGGAFWDTIELLVTGVAFGLMGLELRAALAASPRIASIAGHAVVLCLVVIAIRFAWLLASGPVTRRLAADPDDAPRNWREDVILGWAGMRGLATIAPALALPAVTPQRGTLLFTAFAVIVATLVIPGLTLPLLTRALGVQASAEAEQARLRPLARRATRAALGRLREIESEDELPGDVLDTLRNRARGLVALAGFEPPEESQRSSTVQRIRVAARAHAEILAAARLEIVAARSESGTDPKAADELLRRLDLQSARFELLDAPRLAVSRHG